MGIVTYFILCYTLAVQTPFYASGFLYSLKTQQILLLQPSNLTSFWSTLGGESKKGEETQLAFQRIIYKLLNFDLKNKHIFPVYDYFHNIYNKINYVFYAEVEKTNIYHVPKNIFSWFTFHETLKLPFSTQTKQDLVVGERVINLKYRETEAKNAGVDEGS